jgi:hypothetical protein
MSGVTPQNNVVLQIDSGDFFAFYGVDFGSGGAGAFAIRHAVAHGVEGQFVDIRINDLEGPIIGTLTTQATGTFNDQRVQYTPIQRVSGVHDVYIVFRGSWATSVADWFSFLP